MDHAERSALSGGSPADAASLKPDPASVDAASADAERLQRSIRRLLLGIFLMLLAVVCYFAKDLIMPLLLGVLLTLTLSPVTRSLARVGIGAGIGAVLVVVVAGAVLGLGAFAISEPLTKMVESAPSLGPELREKLASFREPLETVKEVSEQIDEITDGDGTRPTREVVVAQPGLLTAAASSLAAAAASLAVALVMALFMLSTGELFYEKLVSAMPLLSEKKRALRIVRDVERNVSRYLFTITLINAGLGLVVGTLLYVAGMPNAPTWGVIAAVMNFLPFIGALIGTAALAAVAFVSFDTLPAILLPPAIYLGCSVIEGNLVTPLLVGRSLKINVVAVFLTVVVWGWLWGIAGALMAVPILVVLKVVCDHVEGWKTLGHFLSVSAPAAAEGGEG